MTTPPEPKSTWVESSTRITCTVEQIVNTRAKAPLPAMVVYREDSGEVCAEFVDNFLGKRKPFDPEVGHAPDVEIVLPTYQVFIGEFPAKAPPGINYYIDATYECSKEEAELEVRRVIDATYARVHRAPAGIKHQPIFDKESHLKFIRRPNDTRTLLQDQCTEAGLNWVGIIQGTPLIWGNRLSNGLSIQDFIVLASCLRHAFRCTAFTYEDPIAGASWQHHFGDAWRFAQSKRWDTTSQAYQIQIVENILNLRLSQHWFGNEAPVASQMPVLGEGKGSIRLPYVIQKHLQAMYDMKKITGGIA